MVEERRMWREERRSTGEHASVGLDRPGPGRAVAVMLLPAALLTVLIVGFVAARGGVAEEAEVRAALPYMIALNHALVFGALLLVLRGEGRSLVDIGWRIPAGTGRAHLVLRELLVGLVVALALYLFKEIALDPVRQLLAGERPTFTSLFRFRYVASELPLLVVSTTFIVVEESVYRGYGLQALERSWGRARALLAMGVLFGLLHWGNGGLAILFTGIVGVGFGVLYLWRRTLLPVVVAHAAYNAMVVLT